MGATIAARAGFAAALLSLPSSRQDESEARERALAALAAVGLQDLANVRCDRLQHSELRFLEIARAMMSEPAFLLLDEPAAGLSGEEIARLAALVTAISQSGVGVLLVEHHTDLIFEICQQVTVLNLGKVLAAGTCAEVRAHKEVVSAYLGS
jgi:branched-chain amino acid transport system permease protein